MTVIAGCRRIAPSRLTAFWAYSVNGCSSRGAVSIMRIGLHVADFTWPGRPAEPGPGSAPSGHGGRESGFRPGELDRPRMADQCDRPPENAMLEAYTTPGYLAGMHDADGTPRLGDGGRLSRTRIVGQTGQHAGRPVRGPGVAGRRRLVEGGGARAGSAVPADGRAVRAAGGGVADLFADVERG